MRKRRTKRNGDGMLPCPSCHGTKFSAPQIVAANYSKVAEPFAHVKCLDCGTVSYAPLTDGWETNSPYALQSTAA